VSELHDLTALEQGAAIRAGEVSSAELVDHYLERVQRLDKSLGAFVTVTPDRARQAAASVSGDGPLAGVPTAIKDLNSTAGIRTTYGSAVFADYVPDFSDELVLRIEAEIGRAHV
jgi:amidase